MQRNPPLRSRLFFSYLVLVLALLLVMTIAFLIFLFAQPVSAAPTYERLLTTMQSLAQEVNLNSRPTVGEIARLMDQLPQLSTESQTRILVVNMAKDTVIFDS